MCSNPLCKGNCVRLAGGLASFENVDHVSPEECRARLENVIPRALIPDANRWNSDFEKSSFAAAICTFCYPQARDRLLAQGRTAEEVERMPVYQVVAPFVFREFVDAYDRLLVTSTFPAGRFAYRDCRSKKRDRETYSPVDFYLGSAISRVGCLKDRMHPTASIV